MPSVSKKLVTNPIPRSSGWGAVLPRLCLRRIKENQVQIKKTVTTPIATKSHALIVSIVDSSSSSVHAVRHHADRLNFSLSKNCTRQTLVGRRGGSPPKQDFWALFSAFRLHPSRPPRCSDRASQQPAPCPPRFQNVAAYWSSQTFRSFERLR